MYHSYAKHSSLDKFKTDTKDIDSTSSSSAEATISSNEELILRLIYDSFHFTVH